MNKSNFKSVLLAAPTAKSKMYAFSDWLDSAMLLDYQNYVIRLFDNSMDNGANVNKMNRIFHERYGEHNNKFKAIYIPTKYKHPFQRMTDCMEAIRQYAINKRFDYLFSLETDIQCEQNTIEELICQNKQVIGAMYDRDEGMYRKTMIQKIVKESPDSLLSLNFKAGEEVGFINGKAKEVSSIGLGCVLIDMNVLKNLPFRYFDGVAPDKYFSESMHAMKVKIHSHTGLMAPIHNNQEWSLKYI